MKLDRASMKNSASPSQNNQGGDSNLVRAALDDHVHAVFGAGCSDDCGSHGASDLNGGRANRTGSLKKLALSGFVVNMDSETKL